MDPAQMLSSASLGTSSTPSLLIPRPRSLEHWWLQMAAHSSRFPPNSKGCGTLWPRNVWLRSLCNARNGCSDHAPSVLMGEVQDVMGIEALAKSIRIVYIYAHIVKGCEREPAFR